MSSLRRVATLGLVGVVLAACDTGDGRELRAPPPGATAPPMATTSTPTSSAVLGTPPVGSAEGVLALGSSAFLPGTAIPAPYSCDGDGLSPPLSWTGVPAGTVELALTVLDPDAAGQPFVHWVLAGMDPVVTGLGEGGIPESVVEVAPWTGPCPPRGETHDYVFTLYALSQPSGIADGTTADDALTLLAAAPGSTATLIGSYGRPA